MLQKSNIHYVQKLYKFDIHYIYIYIYIYNPFGMGAGVHSGICQARSGKTSFVTSNVY